MSEQVWDNIRRVVERLGVPWVRFTPPGGLMQGAFRGSLERLVPHHREPTLYARGTREFGPLCYACGTLCMVMAIRTAAMWDIPFLATGFTPAQDSAVQRAAAPGAGLPARAYLRMAEPMLRLLESSLPDGWLRSFRVPPGEALDRLAMVRVFDHLPYDKAEVRTVAEQTGFQAPPDTGYGSTNCRLNPLVRAVYSELYGVDKYAVQDAALVRQGLVSRDAVLAQQTPPPTLAETAPLLAELGLTPQALEAILAKGRG